MPSAIVSHSLRMFTAARRRAVRGAARNPWVLSVWAVTLSFLAVAIAVSWHIGVPIRDPEGTLMGNRIVLPFAFMGIFMLLDGLRRARPRWRSGELTMVRAIRETMLSRWGWQRMTLALVGFFAFHVTYLSYRNLKSFVSLWDGESYDQQLLQLDRWMAFGNAPAQLLHDLFGSDLSAHVLSAIYLAFIPLVPISVAAALTFVERMRESYVFLAASIYCWIFGTISYYLIPTLGPFGGAEWQFDGLSYTGVTRVQDALLDHRLELMADPLGYPGVASIGGFASLHVGIVFMGYLMARYYGSRTLATVAMAFLIPTVVATIYFGWHYLVDDVAGFAIGWLAVVGGRWTVYPERTPLARLFARLRRRESALPAET